MTTRPFFFGILVFAALVSCDFVEALPIRFLPLNDAIAARSIGIEDENGLTQLRDLNAKKRSKAYTCTIGDTPLALLALDRQRPNGKPSGVDVIIPAGMKSPLVLMIQDDEHATGLSTFVTEDDVAAFAWGTLRFVNTTDMMLMIRCDKETKPLAAAVSTIDIALEGDSRNIGVQIFAEEKPDLILFSAIWEYDPNIRKVVVITAVDGSESEELALEIIPQDQRTGN